MYFCGYLVGHVTTIHIHLKIAENILFISSRWTDTLHTQQIYSNVFCVGSYYRYVVLLLFLLLLLILL